MRRALLGLGIVALTVPAPVALAAAPAFAAGTCGIAYFDGGHSAETFNCSGIPNGLKVRVVVTCHSPSGSYVSYGPYYSPQYHSAAGCGSSAYASATWQED
jgi:hypothetical protein